MIQFGTSWLLLLPCAALALAASLLAYWYSAFRPPMPWRAVLPALRFCALFLCLTLLLRPLWHHDVRREEPPVLAVLVDESLSIARHDSVLRSALQALPTLEADVRLYGFSSEPRALSAADSLKAIGVRTDIAGALATVQAEFTNNHLAGILLLTDGQYNTGRNPLYVAAESSVPVHTMTVGDTLEQRDIQIRRLLTNEIGYAGTKMPVEISLLARGYENQQVAVSIARGGTVLSTVRTTLPADGINLPVSMEYTPPSAGLHQLTASISRLDGEATHANNVATVPLNILENRQRVLLVAGAPHPDFAAIHSILLHEEEREVTTRVQKDAQTFYEGPIPDSLAAFDLIVLVGFPGPNASPRIAQRLAASGTRLFFVLTQKTSIALLRDFFGESLPVVPVQGRSLYGEAAFELTPLGRQHATLQNLPPISTLQLPPILFNATRWQVSPDARVLAQANVGGINMEGPLLVVRSRGGLRSAALLGSGTWRWQNLPEDLAESDGWWPALVDNLVQWLLAPEDNRRVRVRPVQQTFAGGEAVQFSGQVYDESLQGVDGASVILDVSAPDGTRFPYTLAGVGNGRYAADIGTLPEGSYSYEARALRAEAALGTDTGTFTVGALVLEYSETRANVPLLRQIADRSGGRYLTVHDMDALERILAADSLFVPRPTVETRERALWQWPLLLALVLALLTTEWVLRKRIGMA